MIKCKKFDAKTKGFLGTMALCVSDCFYVIYNLFMGFERFLN